MIEAWKAYFAMFPDFEILVHSMLADNGTVAVFGPVSGTYNGKRGLIPENRISMPAAWKANVADGKVRLWQVYCDWTEGMRTIEEDTKTASQSSEPTLSSVTPPAGQKSRPR